MSGPVPRAPPRVLVTNPLTGARERVTASEYEYLHAVPPDVRARWWRDRVAVAARTYARFM